MPSAVDSVDPGEDDPNLQDRILAANPMMEFYITPFCRAFLRQCLTYDSRRRATVDTLMTSPWIEHHLAKKSTTEKSTTIIHF